MGVYTGMDVMSTIEKRKHGERKREGENVEKGSGNKVALQRNYHYYGEEGLKEEEKEDHEKEEEEDRKAREMDWAEARWRFAAARTQAAEKFAEGAADAVASVVDAAAALSQVVALLEPGADGRVEDRNVKEARSAAAAAMKRMQQQQQQQQQHPSGRNERDGAQLRTLPPHAGNAFVNLYTHGTDELRERAHGGMTSSSSLSWTPPPPRESFVHHAEDAIAAAVAALARAEISVRARMLPALGGAKAAADVRDAVRKSRHAASALQKVTSALPLQTRANGRDALALPLPSTPSEKWSQNADALIRSLPKSQRAHVKAELAHVDAMLRAREKNVHTRERAIEDVLGDERDRVRECSALVHEAEKRAAHVVREHEARIATSLADGAESLDAVLAVVDNTLGHAPSQPRLLLLLERLTEERDALHSLYSTLRSASTGSSSAPQSSSSLLRITNQGKGEVLDTSAPSATSARPPS